MAKKVETTYERWMQSEGIPIVEGYAVEEVLAVSRGHWERMRAKGAFLHLRGMEGITGMYVLEIPPGGSVAPERHVYEELVYVLEGRGAAEVRVPDKPSAIFEWGAGSLFAIPLNVWHQLHNGSSAPALLLAVTNAPILFDILRDESFIFGCDHVFADRYDGQPDYFKVGDRRYHGALDWPGWDTNFVADIRTVRIDLAAQKGIGSRVAALEMGGNVLNAHVAECPVGCYQKAHYHGGGAVVLVVRGKGFTLMWPPEAGTRPYENGHGDLVMKVDWQEGSVLSPPTRWFHQQFNLSPEPSLQVGLRYGSQKYGVGFHDVQREGTLMPSKRRDRTIEYGDEDPEIRRLYTEALEQEGGSLEMPEAIG